MCRSVKQEVRRTLEQEGLVPVGVEVLPLHLGLQLVLFVGQQVDFDEGVRGSREILGGELLASEHLDGEGGVLEAVADAELDPAQLLADGPFAVIVLGTWRQLQGDKRSHVNTAAASAGAIISAGVRARRRESTRGADVGAERA